MFGMKKLRRELLGGMERVCWRVDRLTEDVRECERGMEVLLANDGVYGDRLDAIEKRIPVPCAVCGKGVVPSDENSTVTLNDIASARFARAVCGTGALFVGHVHAACRKGTEYDRRAKKRKKGDKR